MVAAILLVGFACGMVSAVAAVTLLNASIAVAVLAYFVFGVLGTSVTLLAIAARPAEEFEDVDMLAHHFQPSTIPATNR